jgi:predicted dehydrogenase
MMISFGSALDHTTVLKAQANGLENGGGCLLDYGSHGLASAWSILGKRYAPKRVEAIDISVRFRNRVLENEPFVMEVDDNAQIKVLFEDEDSGSWCTLFMETTWCGPHIGFGEHRRESIQILGNKGVIETSWLTDRVTVRTFNGGNTEIPLLEEAGERFFIASGIREFIDCIREEKPPELDSEFGAGIAAVCTAAYLSAIRKRAVTLDELKEYCREFVERFGDGQQADDAIVEELLAPYAFFSYD